MEFKHLTASLVAPNSICGLLISQIMRFVLICAHLYLEYWEKSLKCKQHLVCMKRLVHRFSRCGFVLFFQVILFLTSRTKQSGTTLETLI